MAAKAGSYTDGMTGVLSDTAQNVTNKVADATARRAISEPPGESLTP